MHRNRPKADEMSEPNAAPLRERLLRGEAEAFDELVATHHEAIARLVRRLLAWSNEADDAVQEVFLAAWRRIRSFRGEASLLTWLRTIAVNECRARRRRWRVWRKWLLAQEPSPNGVHSPQGDDLEREERGRRVRMAIAQLGQADREVLVLHYLEQCDVAEIAETLGLRHNTVEVRLHRARQRLKPLLADIWNERE